MIKLHRCTKFHAGIAEWQGSYLSNNASLLLFLFSCPPALADKSMNRFKQQSTRQACLKSESLDMIINLHALPVVFLLLLLGFTSCQKGINGPGTTNTIDSTITDTTQFIDLTLNGNRVFEISSTTAAADANWKWYPVSSFWGFELPDSLYYPLSSLKSGLRNGDPLAIPAFYFLKNSYGLSLEAYINSKQWWTPLVKKTFIDSFFQAGNYSYAVSTSKDTTFSFTPFSDPVTRKLLGTGMQISWVDSKGTVWQTTKGSGDQTNSFFSISDNTSLPFTFITGYSDYTESTLISASFQCNLYDDNGNVIRLTNGRFRLKMTFEQY